MSDVQGGSDPVLDCDDLDRLGALLTANTFRQSFLQDAQSALAEAGVGNLPSPLIEYLVSMTSEELRAVAELSTFLRGFKMPPDVNPCFI